MWCMQDKKVIEKYIDDVSKKTFEKKPASKQTHYLLYQVEI